MLAVILITALACVVGAGAWALAEDRGRADVEIGAGVVRLAWPATGTAQLDLPVSALRPGESAQRVADLTNTGTVGISELQLTFVGTETGSPSDGLLVALTSCTAAWTVVGGNYTCPGVATEVAPTRPVDGRVNLRESPARAVGGVDRLLFTFSLSTSSPPSDQNRSGRVAVTADGVQVPGRQQ